MCFPSLPSENINFPRVMETKEEFVPCLPWLLGGFIKLKEKEYNA
jgi:hypothetical protein